MTQSTLDGFRDIPSEMIWRDAALKQMDAFTALANRLGVTHIGMVGKHISKSIPLPVVKIQVNGCSFTMRDNFYDLNLLVETPKPINLTLPQFFDGVYMPLNWAWYLDQINRARNYSWDQWTDEEMDDPRVLRIKKSTIGGLKSYYQVKSPDEKDRWIKRMADPEWFSKDWSSGELTWEGNFGPGVLLFNQRYPYAEGIRCEDIPRKYIPGSSKFIIALPNIESVETIIRRVAL